MSKDNELIHNWMSFSKFHNRTTRSLDQILQNKYHLGVSDFYLMVFLNENEEKQLRLSQLQHMVGLSQSALSRLISRLENHEMKLIERAIHAEDRRSVYAVLTPNGQEFISNVMAEVEESLRRSLSDKDMRNLKLFID